MNREKKSRVIFTVAILAFLILTQFYIFGHPRESWFDAAFSLETAHQLNENGWSSIDFQEWDVHPPVYYYALAGWQLVRPAALFTEYQWAQELSVLLGLVFLFFVWKGMRKFFLSRRVLASYVILFFAVSTTYVHYGTEPRMYILLLALSAMVFAAIANRLNGKWMYVGTFALMLLPLVHYIASVAIVIFPAMHWFINKDTKGVKNLFAGGLLGFLGTLVFAIPQRMRSAGTWFQNHDITSWPSSLMYTISANGTMEIGHTQLTYFSHILFLLVVVVVAYFAYDRFGTVDQLNRGQRAWYFMFAMLLVPMGYLLFLSFGSEGFFNLYHHRFFLVVTWMFAAALLMTVFRGISFLMKSTRQWHEYAAVWAVVFLVVFVGVLQFSYAQKTHTELREMGYQTPCVMPDGSTVLIGHESPFSALPYQVFERERGCDWEHFISTNLSREWLNAAGYDAFDGEVYYNKTLPTQGFYYIQSDDEYFELEGRNSTVENLGDGIRIRYVYPERSRVEITFT